MTTIADVLDRLGAARDADDDRAAFDLLGELRAHPDLAGVGGGDALGAAQALLEGGDLSDLGPAGDLAYRAHRDGIAGAGLLFATCADRLALLSGRPQRFGTVVMSHQGDAVLAPLDDSVTDELRAQLGLHDRAGLRAQVEEVNRVEARRRAASPGELPGDLPFARVWRDPSGAELRRRWEAEGEPVWADDDELTLVCDRPLAGAIVGPNFELPMWRVDDLLVLTVRVKRLAEAVLTYGFWPLTAEGAPAFRSRPEPDGRWRGPQAPPAPPSTYDLAGTLVDEQVPSAALGRPRAVVVYRPPGHQPSERLPVVYATDGGMFAPYARRLDAGISAGTVPRVVVVAAHSAGFEAAQGGNLRALEYLPGFDQSRFERHERFFVDELSRWAESELGVAEDRDRRAVFGCSDGGGHALAVGLTHHQRFGHVIAYSAGTPPVGRERWPEGGAPYIQLCAGIFEPAFFGATQAWTHWLSLLGIDHHWTERVCGHELIQWVEELPGAVTRAFG